jgi:hypothetical protein
MSILIPTFKKSQFQVQTFFMFNNHVVKNMWVIFSSHCLLKFSTIANHDYSISNTSPQCLYAILLELLQNAFIYPLIVHGLFGQTWTTWWERWFKGLICCLWVWVTMGYHFCPLNDSPNLTLKNINPLRDNFHHQKISKHVSSWIYAYIKRWMKGTIVFEQAIKHFKAFDKHTWAI